MTARKAWATDTLAAIIPLWLACYRFGEAFPQSGAGAWPFLLGAAYCLCVLSSGGLCAYVVRLRELSARVAC